MKFLKHVLLLLIILFTLGNLSHAQTVTPQWKAGTGYILNFYPGKSPAGYDTLGYVGYLRNLFKLKSDSVNNDGYVTHGYLNTFVPVNTGSNGVRKIDNDFSLGGGISGVSFTGEDAFFTTSLHTSDGKYQMFFGGSSSNIINQTISILPRIDISSTQAAFQTIEGNKIKLLININDTGFVATSHKMGFELNTGLETDSYALDTSYTTRYTDEWRHKGIVYSSVDRNTFTDTTLVDKGYVDSLISSGSTPADSSLRINKNLFDVPNKATARLNLGITGLLNGKVDTATYDVFLIGPAQSNGQGHGDSTSSTRIVPGSAVQYYNGQITELMDPVGNAIYGSMWPAFALRYYQLTGHKLLFIPRARGGSAMCAQSDGGNGRWSESGLLRYQARDTTIAALAKMATLGMKIGKISGIMVQGEQEGVAIVAGTETIAQYRDTIANTFAFFRTYWPKMQFGIVRTGKTVGFDFNSGARNAQKQVADADSLTAIITYAAYDLNERGMVLPDGIHYNQRGLNYLGDDAAQQFVTWPKKSNMYYSFQKTGFGVNTPLGYVDVAAGTDTIPGLILRKGVITTTAIKGALMPTGLHLTYTDSTSTNRMLAKYTTASGIAANNVPYASTNSNLTSDTTFQYNGTNLGIGVKPGTYSATSRVYIKSIGTGTGSMLNMYDSGNTLRFRFIDNGQFIIQNGGALNVGTGSGGIATVIFRGPDVSSSTNVFQVQNSATTSLFNIADDGLISLNGAQMFRLPTIAGNPGFLSDRGLWYNSNENNYKGRRNGVTISFAALTDTGTFRSFANSMSLAALQTKFNLYATLASPTFTGNANFTNINSGKLGNNVTFNSGTGTTADSLVFSNAQKLVKKIVVAGTGMTTTQTATSYTPAVDTTIIPTKANSYTLSGMQTKLNLYGKLVGGNSWTDTQTFNTAIEATAGIRIKGGNPANFYNPANTFTIALRNSSSAANRIIELPDVDGSSSVGIINTTTIVLSSATLNSTYPGALPGTQIICQSIIAGAAIYVKGSGSTWLTVASTITP